MSHTTYDYIVIGKGLMGAAAARHLSAYSQSVALIGPDEPADRATHQGVFGSHYDEGRITRILDPERIWALLAQRSIARYRDLEQRSGIAFYHEVGHLAVGPEPQGTEEYVARLQAIAQELGVVCETYEAAALAERFPFLTFPPGSVGMYQPHSGGHVSPRLQVQAHVAVASQQGTHVIPAIVQRVRQVDGHVEVQTEAGDFYQAGHVLVATGAFSNTKHLLPRRLETTVYARTIVLFELDHADIIRLREMPSIIHKPKEPSERCYILPPIRYPDGKYYLKIGGETHDPTLHSLEALTAWFRSPGRAAAADALTQRLLSIVPDVRPLSIHTDTCVTTHTPTGNLYIDKLPGGRVGMLTGGNGSAAKAADEIGRVGALMLLHNEWAYDLDAHHFRARFVEA